MRRLRRDRAFADGSGATKEKGRGGPRNPLIRLDSAKETQGFNLDFLPVFL
jgi:hypothetical protein